MSSPAILFYFFVVLAASAALGILFIRNVFKAALLLLVCLLSLAGLYVLLSAELVAVTQIMIYAGGVLVVIIFGIMLTSRIAGKTLETSHGYIVSGIIVLIGLAAIAVPALLETFGSQTWRPSPVVNTVEETGYQLMGSFVFPFEAVGILLLISLVAAAVLSSKKLPDR